MPTVIQLRFPGRRYHATPWGHHVNEGVIEWPPSPWRLLRALLATGFAKRSWDPAGPPAVARALVEALAGVTPTFALPPACLAHSRHYVAAEAKKPLILDTWARIEHDAPPLEIVWPCELVAELRDLLGDLAASLGYLGRAESWVEGRLLPAPQRVPNCSPGTAPLGPGWEPARVLCPQGAAGYRAWRESSMRQIDQRLPLPGTKKPPTKLLKERTKALEPYPVDLVAAICSETGRLQAQGWSSPPGSQEIVYWRRTDALGVGAVRGANAVRRSDKVSFVLLALSTPSRNRSGLPAERRVFPQGRLLHKTLAAVLDRVGARGEAGVLLGRDGENVARTNHRHAHLLHLDLDGDGRLDHALVWAPAGIGTEGLRVLRTIRRTWMKGGVGELQVSVAASGSIMSLRPLDAFFHGRLSALLGPTGGARQWISITPFVAPRLTKKRGKDSLPAQVQAELERRGLPHAEIAIFPPHDDLRLSFRHHVLHDREHRPPMPVTHAVSLCFDRPVEGPVCLGWGSHYGLGRFAASYLVHTDLERDSGVDTCQPEGRCPSEGIDAPTRQEASR